MDTSKFDAQIKILEDQIDSLQSEIEGICKEFLKATKKFLPEWYRNKVENTIMSNPELAKEYGAEGLSLLKSDLNRLISDTPKNVEKHLNQDSCWPHRGKHIDPVAMIGCVRELFGYVGNLLNKHGFADTTEESESWSNEMTAVSQQYSEGRDKLADTLNKLNEIKKKKTGDEVKDLWENA